MSSSQSSPQGSLPPLFAEGLEVLDNSTPWRQKERLPEKPGGYLYGVRFKNHPKEGDKDYPCGSEEELHHVIAENGAHVGYVYLPDRDHGIPRLSLNIYSPWKKSDLRQLFFRTLQMRGLLGVGAIGAALYLQSQLSFTLLIFGLIFGIIPVFDNLIQWLMYPKRISSEELKMSMVDSSVFFGWIDKGKRSKLLIWISLILLGIVYYGQNADFQRLTDLGKIDPAAIRIGGEWWRLFTGTLMHGAIIHILMNALGFFYIGKFIHRLTSPIMVIIVFVITAFTGALASAMFAPPMGSVGASGGVVGMIGFLAWLAYARRSSLPYDFRSFTIRNIILLTMIGIIPFIDNAGHAGGFIGGIACGIVYHATHRFQWDTPLTPVKLILGIVCSGFFLFGFICCADLFFFNQQYIIPHLPKIPW